MKKIFHRKKRCVFEGCKEKVIFGYHHKDPFCYIHYKIVQNRAMIALIEIEKMIRKFHDKWRDERKL